MPTRARTSTRTLIVTVIVSVVATLAAVLLFVNLTTGEKRIKQKFAHLYAVHDPQFLRTMGVLLGPAILEGNRFEVLQNGDQIFPPMLDAIRHARKTINFETYIYWSGAIGKEFADALSDRARAGVKVSVLLDWLGSGRMDKALLDQMESSGVRIKRFHEPRWYNLDKLNNRTHRKILVVDGHVGFTGGVGIAPEWTGKAQDPDHWRDTHFRVEGPVVAQMQSVFSDNWVKATGDVLHGDTYFPPLAPVGAGKAQIFASSPSGGSESMELMYVLAFTAAEKSIDLEMAYFVPDELSRDVIVDAIKRGVRVRIIVPGPHNDAETVRHASRASWGDLLQAGVQIYEFQPTMFHCKVMIVDGLMISVGSTNFDDRSFRLNDEANLNIFDEPFAARQTEIFEQDLARSRRVTHGEWLERPFTEKLWGYAARLLGPQL
ncbi:MAG: phospholipase D-like domain-containing protein [Betaproteobacteria bacterium]